MSDMEAVRTARALYVKWVGYPTDGRIDYDRMRNSMLQELRYDLTKPERRGVVREIRREMILLGKVRKVLGV